MEPGPIVVTEHVESRDVEAGPTKQVTARYKVTGSADEMAVLNAVAAFAPTTWTMNDVTLYPLSVTCEPEYADEVNSDGLWSATVVYGIPDWKSSQAGTSTLRFTIGGDSVHVTQSKSTRRYGTGPNFGGAINVQDGSNVNGVDIDGDSLAFEFTYYANDSQVNQTWVSKIWALCPAVNNAAVTFSPTYGPHITFAAGSLKLKGLTSNLRGDGITELVFSFAASKNVAGATIGGITGITKNGWEYAWVLYEDTDDTAAKKTIPKPIGVYIEQVFDSVVMDYLP